MDSFCGTNTQKCMPVHTCGRRAASPSAHALHLGRHGKLQGENTCGSDLIFGVREV